MPKCMGCSKSYAKENFIAINAYITKRKILNKYPNFTPQGTRKRKIIKPKVSRSKQIIKICAENNEIEKRETIEKKNQWN